MGKMDVIFLIYEMERRGGPYYLWKNLGLFFSS